MSCNAGPDIAESGLIFHFNMANTQKSWKGAPTTNLLSNPTNEVIGTTSEFVQYANLAPIFDTYGLQPYSLSLDLKAAKAGPVLVYMQNGSTTRYSFVNQSVSATTDYQRFTFNNLTPAISTISDTAATLAFYGTYGSGVIPSIKNVRVEFGPVATSFVNTARSQTQAILDLTGNYVITANSLVYNSDNTFSFNGTSNYITTYNTTILGSQTFAAWAVVTGSPNSLAGIITQHNYASNANFGINYVGGNKLAASIGYTNGTREYQTKTTTYTVSLNVPFFVVLVYNSDENKIYWYINGQPDSSYALSATPNLTSWPICSGRWDAGYNSYYFAGKVYASQIYNRALSQAEITQNFNALRGRFGI